MKRREAEWQINDWLDHADEITGKTVIDFVASLGMRPPCLDEDKCQAILEVYYGGYSLNQWDEDFEKDEKVVEAHNKRMANKK